MVGPHWALRRVTIAVQTSNQMNHRSSSSFYIFDRVINWPVMDAATAESNMRGFDQEFREDHACFVVRCQRKDGGKNSVKCRPEKRQKRNALTGTRTPVESNRVDLHTCLMYETGNDS